MTSEIRRSATYIAENYAQDCASVIVAYRCIEFRLQASRTALASRVDDYTANVNVLDGVVARNDDTMRTAFQALRDLVLGHFAERMQALAPVPRDLRTLQDAAACVRYSLLGDSDGGIEMLENTLGPSYDLMPVSKAPGLNAIDDVECFQADQVLLINRSTPIGRLLGEAWLSSRSRAEIKVFLKPAESGKGAGFQRALAVYLKILGYPKEQRRARIPQLLGIVPSLSGTDILGFVTDWVDGPVLAKIDDRRMKDHGHVWKDQVRRSIEFLHTISVIWGDINAHNVLIDENNQAWICDFSGGLTTEAELEPSMDNKKREFDILEELFDGFA